MANRQIGAFKGQQAKIKFWQDFLTKLKAGAVSAPAGAPFPVALRASCTAELIEYVTLVFNRAETLLAEGIAYFERTDRELAELQAKGDDGKVEFEKLTAEVNAQEGVYAGKAAAAQWAIGVVAGLFPQIQEGVPTYRD